MWVGGGAGSATEYVIPGMIYVVVSCVCCYCRNIFSKLWSSLRYSVIALRSHVLAMAHETSWPAGGHDLCVTHYLLNKPSNQPTKAPTIACSLVISVLSRQGSCSVWRSLEVAGLVWWRMTFIIFSHRNCWSHINSHDQVRGHMTGSSHPEEKEYGTPGKKTRK